MICVDCVDFVRVGLICYYFEEDVVILNIDYYFINDVYGMVNIIKLDVVVIVEILFDFVNLFLVMLN